jgi:16S rRNA C967 or C1407 C5-methylase (RsmB/RsmF family)/NOL1/NOP2/fmu family ribosome biogenesis protein
MQALLSPAEWSEFEAALHQPPPVSIRLNPAKHPDDLALLPAASSPIPWHPEGRYLAERPVFTLDPLLHAGAYYVQEASSMLLHAALTQALDLSKPLKILDLCAAPGGKSTLLSGLTNRLTANEVIRSRVSILRENLERWGAVAAVGSAEAEEWAEGAPEWFDVVVADAPCSGEGLFRKDPDAVAEWSPDNVALCAGRQRRILAAAVEALAPGGVLAYSTCTYNRAENEDNTAWLAKELGLEFLPLTLPAEWGVLATEGGYRCLPHRVQGEGFFLCLLRKPAGDTPRRTNVPSAFRSLKPLAKNQLPEMDRWLSHPSDLRFFQTPNGEVLALPAAREEEFLLLDKCLKNKWFGVQVGEFKGKDFTPHHALALSGLAATSLPRLDLSREQALIFLKKETFDVPDNAPRGWALACYGGLPLGWVKVLPNRLNNYLPPERRIRMSL